MKANMSNSFFFFCLVHTKALTCEGQRIYWGKYYREKVLRLLYTKRLRRHWHKRMKGKDRIERKAR